MKRLPPANSYFQRRLTGMVASLALASSLCSGAVQAQEPNAEQVIYLPIYSHVYFGDVAKDGKPEQKLLSAHVSIRNTDPRQSIRVLSAQYDDTEGKLIKNYLSTPVNIAPFGTAELFVPKSDLSGGSGANFVIAWRGPAGVNAPLVEAVHVAQEMSRTMTFVTNGRPIQAK